MKEISAALIAEALGIRRQNVWKRAIKESWSFRETAYGRLYDLESLPPDVQLKIMQIQQHESPIQLPESWTAKPALDVNEAMRSATETERGEAFFRAAMITVFEDEELNVKSFCDQYNAGAIPDLLPALRKIGPVSSATFYRWLNAWRHDGPAAIIPQFARRNITRVNTSLSIIERGYLEYWYLTPNRTSIESCFRTLLQVVPDSKATEAACRAYLQSLPKPYRDFYRLGRSKFENAHLPRVERDPELYSSMEQAVSDHHNFDFLVEKDGRIFRPWITTFQDYRSSKIVGWCPSIYPSSLTISVAYYRMVIEHGAPEYAHTDNGKDFKSQLLNGMTKEIKVLNKKGIEEEALIRVMGAFALCGSKVIRARPYSATSKGRQERWYRTASEYVSKYSGSYVGSNTVSRPEDSVLFWRSIKGKAKKTDGIWRWEFFVEAIEAFIRWWNANWRGEAKGLDGCTPNEVFAANFKGKREVPVETLELAFSRPEVRRIRGNGVTIGDVQYWAPELFQYSGQDVIVRSPLGTADYVTVMLLNGQVLCKAQANWFIETEDLAAVNERVSSAKRHAIASLPSMGVGRIEPPAGSRSIIEVAMRTQPRQIGGIENVFPTRKPSEPAAETPRKSRLISPLDVGLNQEDD
jgi:hypothetical protein